MAAFVEQVSEATQWTDNAGRSAGLTGSPTPAALLRPRWSGPKMLSAREQRAALLRRVVEAEVLPRLVLTRGPAAPRSATSASPAAAASELMRLVLANDFACAVAFIEQLQAAGTSAEALYLGVLSDAARQLGELWLADRADFVQVTLATGLLQQLLRLLAPAFQADATSRADPPSVMLITVPGEQHTFGMSMLGQFFSRAGWHVTGGPSGSAGEVLDTVRHAWIDVAAFSIGSTSLLEALALLIHQVRRESRNPGLRVMVGGPLLLQLPELARRVGGDAAAPDAQTAVHLASDMLAMRVAAE